MKQTIEIEVPDGKKAVWKDGQVVFEDIELPKTWEEFCGQTEIKNGGLTHTISIDTDIDGNLPYDLAEAFAEVIRLTNANPDMVIEELVAKYGFPESMQTGGDSENENNKRIWHDASEEPKSNQWYIAQTGDNSFDTFRKSIDNNEDWIKWSNGFKIKRWAHINDLLPKGGE